MEKNKNLPLILVLGLPLVLIISSFMARVNIKILGSPLYISAFIYPLTYLITCMILKKSTYKHAIYIMCVALISQSLSCVVQWVMLNTMDSMLMISTFLSFLFGQLIIIYIYDFLVKNKKDGYFAILLLILLVTLLDCVFLGTLIEGQIISITILIRLIYVVIIPLLIARKN